MITPDISDPNMSLSIQRTNASWPGRFGLGIVRLFVVVALFLVAVTGAFSQQDVQPSTPPAGTRGLAEANRAFERGNDFFKKNSLQRAKSEYQKAVKLFPRHLDALYNLAIVCERLDQKDEAIGIYKQYLDIQPRDPDAWTQLGVLYDATGKTDDARAAYEKAIQLNSKAGLAHHNLGVLLKEAGRFDDALKHLETFVQLEEATGSPNPDAYFSLGVLYLARGNVTAAKLTLQKALDGDPSIARYNNAMGDVFWAEKLYDMAISHYRKAIAKEPQFALPHSGLGDALAEQGKTDDARAAYNKALELRPDYHLVHFKLGRLCQKTGQTGDAIKHFEKYLSSGKTLAFRDEATAALDQLRTAMASPKP